jgi:hypothetical protein
MSLKNMLKICWDGLRVSCAAVLVAQLSLGAVFTAPAQAQEKERLRHLPAQKR